METSLLWSMRAGSTAQVNSTHAEHQISCSFANVMFKGKTHAALNLFANSGKGSLLHLDDKSYTSYADPSSTVKDSLLSKHTHGQPANAVSAKKGALPVVHQIIFDAIDATLVHKIALRTKGVTGLDAYAWCRFVKSLFSLPVPCKCC